MWFGLMISRQLVKFGRCAAFATLLVWGLSVHAGGLGEERAAAREMADWAIVENRAEALAVAIGLMLDAGASDAAGVPFSVHDDLLALKNLPGGEELARNVLQERARGVALGGGNSRIELVLNAGDVHTETLVMAANEPALVEVRLYRSSIGADADLTIRDATGRVVGRDVGPLTGIVGDMAYVEFTPETCLSVDVQIVNAGDATAHMVVLAPPALGRGCGG